MGERGGYLICRGCQMGGQGVQGVILLGRGRVNRQQQWSQVILFTVGHIGRDGARFWVGNFIFWG